MRHCKMMAAHSQLVMSLYHHHRRTNNTKALEIRANKEEKVGSNTSNYTTLTSIINTLVENLMVEKLSKLKIRTAL